MADAQHPANVRELAWLTLGALKGVEHPASATRSRLRHLHRIRPVLQAAHIRPLPAGGEHRLDNGLLLRSDVHTLYDRGTSASIRRLGYW